MILSDFSVIILTAATGQTPNSALCTTLTAILVIPPALWMYRGDGKPAANRLKVLQNRIQKGVGRKENGGPTLTWHIFMGIACFVSGGILDRSGAGAFMAEGAGLFLQIRHRNSCLHRSLLCRS